MYPFVLVLVLVLVSRYCIEDENKYDDEGGSSVFFVLNPER